MRVPVIFKDTKHREHSIETDDGATAEQLKALLLANALVPEGFTAKLCYRNRVLSDSDSLSSIDFTPSSPITFLPIRSPKAPPSPSASLPSSDHSIPSPTAQPSASHLSTPIQPPPSLSTSELPPPPPSHHSVPQSSVPTSGIHSFGFDTKLVARALKLTRGNEEQAINVILDGTLDTLPEEIDEEILNEEPSNFSSGGGHASSVSKEVRDALREAVLSSGAVPGGAQSGPIFDMALDQFLQMHPDAATQLARTPVSEMRKGVREAARQSGLGGRQEPKLYEIGGDDDPDVIAEREAAASSGNSSAVAYD